MVGWTALETCTHLTASAGRKVRRPVDERGGVLRPHAAVCAGSNDDVACHARRAPCINVCALGSRRPRKDARYMGDEHVVVPEFRFLADVETSYRGGAPSTRTDQS